MQALRRLTHEYSRAVDSSRLEDVVDLFAPDAEWDASDFGMGVLRGTGRNPGVLRRADPQHASTAAIWR